MSEDDDEDLARDLEGNQLVDPDDIWEFFGNEEQCPNCNGSFWLPSELEYHEPCFNLLQKGCAKCPMEGCNELFSDLTQLRAHHNDCHELIESFYCSICVFRCCSFTKIMEHKYSSHQTEIDNHNQPMTNRSEENMRATRQQIFRDSPDEPLSNGDINQNLLPDDSISVSPTLDSNEFDIPYDVVCYRYQCNDCDEAFNTVHELVLHDPCFRRRGSLTYCSECDVNFSSRADFKIHLEDVHDTAMYICCQCHSEFKKGQDLKEHFKSCFKHSL